MAAPGLSPLGIAGKNPSREYKWFRPRQAYRGVYGSGTPSNYATISLYNGGSSVLLVVRGIAIYLPSNNICNTAYLQGTQGTLELAGVSFMPGEPSRAGSVYYKDTSTVITRDWSYYVTSSAYSFFPPYPLAIVPPAWNYVVQHNFSGNAMGIAFMWEEIAIDELDYFYAV